MNERIQELARRAGIATEVWHKDAEGHGYKTANYQAEKFAELIVQECEHVSLKCSHRNDDMGAIIARDIKEHFGIEE
jgi:hypothetical protein